MTNTQGGRLGGQLAAQLQPQQRRAGITISIKLLLLFIFLLSLLLLVVVVVAAVHYYIKVYVICHSDYAKRENEAYKLAAQLQPQQRRAGRPIHDYLFFNI